MTDDEAFIRAIVAAPADEAPRLIYADWLEERDDPRAAYLRAEVAAFRCIPESKARNSGLWHLLDEAVEIDPVWVARISRPPAGVCCDRIQFVDNGHPLGHGDLKKLETALGIRLPSEYAAFLLNFNGGYPRSRRFRMDIDFLTAERCDEVGGFCRVGTDRTDLPDVRLFGTAEDDDSSIGEYPAELLGIATLPATNDLSFMGTEGAWVGRIFRPTPVDVEQDQPGGVMECFPTLGTMFSRLQIFRAAAVGWERVV